MLHGGYQSVLEARSREEFRGEVIRFAQGLGFDTVAATAVQDQTLIWLLSVKRQDLTLCAADER